MEQGNRKLSSFSLMGIQLDEKTSNKNDQSNIACGKLWHKFELEKIASKINGKLTDEIFAVYFDYEGDYNESFSYFIGCKVSDDEKIPEGMHVLNVPEQNYRMIIAKGKMPKCISESWKIIWNSDINRSYIYDFEIYDHRSEDWSNAEVEIFISTK